MWITYQNKKTDKEIIDNGYIDGYSFELSKESSLLFFGDNLKMLTYLLCNGYRETIDLIYIDPPYNTLNDFTVCNKRSNTISRSAGGSLAYSDKREMGEYLDFLYERLVLLRELLSQQGSIYLHIDYKIGHYVKILMDEVFGMDNFKNDISRIKSNPKNFSRKAYGNEKDMILFYAKNHKKNIFNQITIPLNDDEKIRVFDKIDVDGRRYNTVPVHAPGETKDGETGKAWRGVLPPKGRHWRSSPDELDRLDALGLLEWSKNGVPRIKKFVDEHKGKKIQDIWCYKDPIYPNYPTQKNLEMLDMIVRQSSNEDSVILDCFAGGGSTLIAADRLDRKWIGCDVSPIAIETIQKQINPDRYQLIEMN